MNTVRRPTAVVLAVLACGLASCADRSHLVAEEGAAEGRLAAEWIAFAPPTGRPPVLLMNMVHFGAPEFYARASERVDAAAFAIMEGVKRPRAADVDAARVPAGPLARLEAAYGGAAAALGLTTQSAAMRPGPHWRSPDVAESEAAKSPLLEEFVVGAEAFRRAMEAGVAEERARIRAAYPELATAEVDAFAREGELRRAAALSIARAEVDEDEVLIVRRNEAALRELLSLGDVRREVVLCYGAAHGPHFARRLRQMGWTPVASEFVTVFPFRVGPRRAAGARRRAA
jgi:hypothetical protein